MNKNVRLFSIKYPKLTPKGEQNFIGYVIQNFDDFKSNCNDETKDTYIGRYNDDIFPIINIALTMDKFDEELIQKYLNVIQNKTGSSDDSMRKNYSHLFTDAINHYYKRNEKESINPLWGTYLQFYASNNTNNLNDALSKIPKSLSIDQNIKAYDYLYTDPCEEGEKIGLAIMFALPSRENEVVGMTFGSTKQIGDYDAYFMETGYNSTVHGKRVLKSGSKTCNSPRANPLINFLLTFLKKREEYVKKMTNRDNVDDLPIACKKDFITNCTAKEISAAGKAMLKDILGYSKEDYSTISALLEQKDEEYDIDEKTPTAYILRRNIATIYHNLSLEQTEIQYVMGHDMSNAPLDRKFYGSEEFLLNIYKKIHNHPLNKLFGSDSRINEEANVSKNINDIKLKVHDHMSLQISTREQNDPVRICIEGQQSCIITENLDMNENDEIVDISKQLLEAYKKEYSKIHNSNNQKKG